MVIVLRRGDAMTDAPDREHSLATWIAAADERLDRERASCEALCVCDWPIVESVALPKRLPCTFIAGWPEVFGEIVSAFRSFAMRHSMSEAFPQLVREHARREARFHDEIDALRAFHAAKYANRSGTMARMMMRAELGGAGSSSGSPVEPSMDPAIEAVRRVLASLGEVAHRVLYLTFVELDAPHLGKAGVSAQTIAGRVRRDEGMLPRGSTLRAECGTSAATLVAERLGWIGNDASVEAATAKVTRLTTEARRALRWGLQRVCIDSGVLLPLGDAERVLDDARAFGDVLAVECCAGGVVGGVWECRVIVVEGASHAHPSMPWRRCEHCARPSAPFRVASRR